MTGALRWLGVSGEFTVRPYSVDEGPRFSEPLRDHRLAAIVDIETLGLEPDAPVIELAVRRFAYHPAVGELLGRVDDYSSLRDPGVPIPAEITKLTGITDNDVRGHSIGVQYVTRLLEESAIVIAHNAAFDRPRVDRLLTVGPKACWVCSSEMVDWAGHGLPSRSLGALCMAHGFYSDAHRAMGDVAALGHLLMQRNAETGRTYFQELLAEARRPTVEVFAWGSPFEAKDALKAREYRWNPDHKVWSKVIHAEDSRAEQEWLTTEAWCEKPQVIRIDPRRRFA